jgi:exopolysaccharide biosynthesis polyprenyl glycosylphosphotransferase
VNSARRPGSSGLAGTDHAPLLVPIADLVNQPDLMPSESVNLSDTPLAELRPSLMAEITGLPLTGLASAPLERPHLRRSALPYLVASDVLCLAAALVGGQLLELAATGHGSIAGAAASIGYLPVFLVVLNFYGMYEKRRRRLVATSFPDLNHLVHGLIISCLFLLLLGSGAHGRVGLPRVEPLGASFVGVLGLVSVPIGRAVTRRLLMRHPSRHGSKVLIVGSGVIAASVVARLSKVDGLEVVGCVDDNVMAAFGSGSTVQLLGGLDDLQSIVTEYDIDHLVVAFSPATGAKLAALLRSLAGSVQISVVPRLFDLLTVRSRVDDIAGLTVVDVAPASLGRTERFVKRSFDIAVSSTSLLALSPVLITLAIAIKVTSRGSVLFKQSRTGLGRKEFAIYKFRTMRSGAESEKAALTADNEVDGPLFKIKTDPRVTKIGRRLRQTSLDELPQLLNVLKGNMSLVGPRPFVTTESAEITGWAGRRFDVRPGMTGLWQTSGRNDLPFQELCRLDYAYVASWSLWWDARILWHTPGLVLRRQGAY